MNASALILTSADRSNPTNSNTVQGRDSGQTQISNFLTIQSLANFPAITAAITVAWKALQALDESTFASRLTPLLLAATWLLVSLVISAREADRATMRSA
jgi:hypothetical protein